MLGLLYYAYIYIYIYMYINIYIRSTLLGLYISPRPVFVGPPAPKLLRALAREIFIVAGACPRNFYRCGRLPAIFIVAGACPRNRETVRNRATGRPPRNPNFCWSAHRETVVPGKQKNKKTKNV